MKLHLKVQVSVPQYGSVLRIFAYSKLDPFITNSRDYLDDSTLMRRFSEIMEKDLLYTGEAYSENAQKLLSVHYMD